MKVHVHNERPDQVIAYGLTLGTLTRITVENLDTRPATSGRPGEEFVGAASGAAVGLEVPQPPPDEVGIGVFPRPAGDDLIEPPTPITRFALGVVAVAPSDGLATILADVATPFREHGPFRIVRGGQSANPSTGELLEAVRATAADELLILPNNPNVILAARQVATMADVPIHVVPTRNVAEGIAAMMELDVGRRRGQRDGDGRGRAGDPDAPGDGGGAGCDGQRQEGEEGPDDRPRSGRWAARRRHRRRSGGARGARPR